MAVFEEKGLGRVEIKHLLSLTLSSTPWKRGEPEQWV